MTFSVPKQGKPLVYIETANKYYARYVGWRHCHGRFVSNRELDHYEIELFRTNPETMCAPEDLDPILPLLQA
jgi:hypothetical protein